MHRDREAVVEFQKILDHRGIVLNEPIGALAHLQIGRAYATQKLEPTIFINNLYRKPRAE